MPLITNYLRDAIRLEVEPRASTAFEAIAHDHGRAFAEAYRDQILAAKLVAQNEASIAGRAPEDIARSGWRT